MTLKTNKMKKLLLLIPFIFFGCSMDYTYEYLEGYYYEVESEAIQISLQVKDQLAPNTYVLECHINGHNYPVNSISLVVNYDPEKVTFKDEVEIGSNLYINEWDDIQNLGGTFYFNNGSQFRYSFATIQNVTVGDEFIFREIIEVHGTTVIDFSEIDDEMEVTDLNNKKYPLKVKFIKFTKNE